MNGGTDITYKTQKPALQSIFLISSWHFPPAINIILLIKLKKECTFAILKIKHLFYNQFRNNENILLYHDYDYNHHDTNHGGSSLMV